MASTLGSSGFFDQYLKGNVAVILASSDCAWGTRFILLPMKARGWTSDFYCVLLVQLLFRSHKRWTVFYLQVEIQIGPWNRLQDPSIELSKFICYSDLTHSLAVPSPNTFINTYIDFFLFPCITTRISFFWPNSRNNMPVFFHRWGKTVWRHHNSLNWISVLDPLMFGKQSVLWNIAVWGREAGSLAFFRGKRHHV